MYTFNKYKKKLQCICHRAYKKIIYNKDGLRKEGKKERKKKIGKTEQGQENQTSLNR